MIEDCIYSDDKLNEECGIFGIFNHSQASFITYLGLYALQHRGQESTGIVSSDGKILYRHTGMGLVRDVFSSRQILNDLQGNHAIGHNRYSTTGGSFMINTQPVVINFKAGQLAAAHNGNLTNSQKLRNQMENDGSIFTTTTDTEVIMHLVARSKSPTIAEMIRDSLAAVEGAFSVIFLCKDEIIAARDPLGVRPLSIGKLGESFVVASETCAFDLIDAQFVRDIKPGEVIKISEKGLETLWILPKKASKYAHCVFEHIYFSRPDSVVFESSVDDVRRAFGRQLAKEYEIPKNADFVMGVPDSAIAAALGYADGAGLPFQIGLIRNHYVGRTFIRPGQENRDFSVKVKFNPIISMLKDKIIVVVDDSIVRGTTMRKVMKLIRAAGPKEIHLRISSPPIIFPCFYGVNMSVKEKFIANNKTIEEIREYLDVDSLHYLTIDGMLSVLPQEKRSHFCCACFDGDYPISVEDCIDGQPMGCNL
jgi:amidophosphoribosyltransferase